MLDQILGDAQAAYAAELEKTRQRRRKTRNIRERIRGREDQPDAALTRLVLGETGFECPGLDAMSDDELAVVIRTARSIATARSNIRREKENG